MIIVRVELHSAVTGKVTELARMMIHNVGGSRTFGNYGVRVYRGRSAEALDRRTISRTGDVEKHNRLRSHVWHLVAKALKATGYFKTEEEIDMEQEASMTP